MGLKEKFIVAVLVAPLVMGLVYAAGKKAIYDGIGSGGGYTDAVKASEGIKWRP